MELTKSLHVLLVEDSLLTAQQVRESVQKIPMPITVAAVMTPGEAIESVCRDQPDIILLDIHLKGGSGFSVLREAVKRNPKPTIIMMTNFALPPYRQYALLAGADYFLDKALDLESVPSLVEEIARRRAAEVRH